MLDSVTDSTVPDETVLKETADQNENMNLFYLIACVTGFFLLLLICVLVMLIKSRRSKLQRHGLFLSEFENGRSSCKSAPMSRTSSPTREKRRSYSHAYGAVDKSMVRSNTLDNLPSLETELVQPDMEGEKSKSFTALQYQSSFLGTHPQIPLIRAEAKQKDFQTGSSTEQSSHGRLWFSVFYDDKSNKLLVTLIKVSELEGRSPSENWRDPFVKIFLLPDENVLNISRVVKKTLNPVFNETFEFELPNADYAKRSIRFSVYDVDRRRLRHSLGHVVVPLTDVDMHSSDMICKQLDTGIHPGPSAGEINLALSYLPHMERLKIVILRARHIHPTPDADTAFYVRLHLHYGNKLVKIKQTLTQAAIPEVNFNESFAFSTSNKNIDNFYFVVTLVQTHRSSMSRDVELGHVTLGSFMFARGPGLIHWQDMIAKTRAAVTKWHQLS